MLNPEPNLVSISCTESWMGDCSGFISVAMKPTDRNQLTETNLEDVRTWLANNPKLHQAREINQGRNSSTSHIPATVKSRERGMCPGCLLAALTLSQLSSLSHSARPGPWHGAAHIHGGASHLN